MTSPTEGGSGGASPPSFTRTTITSKSPSEAVFIVLYYIVRTQQKKMKERGCCRTHFILVASASQVGELHHISGRQFLAPPSRQNQFYMKVRVHKIDYMSSPPTIRARIDIIDILGCDFMYNRLYDFCDIQSIVVPLASIKMIARPAPQGNRAWAMVGVPATVAGVC